MNASIARIYLEGATLIFGGPYSNLEATLSLLEEAKHLEIPRDRIICTGDIVAYGADPAATVDAVRRAGIHVVMGNCEESLASSADTCGCGFTPGSSCDRLSDAWFAYANNAIGAETRAWMAGLPRRIDLIVGGHELAVVHGGVSNVSRFIFASTTEAYKIEELDRANTDGVIGGHCGLPFTQIVNGQLWHNPGAIGMPANDGTPRVWFGLLYPESNGLRIEHRALAYDHGAAARKMRAAGLPDDYAAAIETGLWPSCDVLPLKEIRQRGVPLIPGFAYWMRPAAERRAMRNRRSVFVQQLWPDENRNNVTPMQPAKFADPLVTAKGEPRASVTLHELKTLWFNTGTLCNITCRNCYIESSPKNDRLVYLTRADVMEYLEEIQRNHWETDEIGFTGGEPFMNPELIMMLDDCLDREFRVLVLTNAMRPMQRARARLLELKRRFGEQLAVRVSLDHFTPERHEEERGPGTFRLAVEGLVWLSHNGFNVSVAGRTMWGEDLGTERAGYAQFFAEHGIPIDASNPAELVLFPEMDPKVDIPEISTSCWSLLGKSPSDVMCATSRMVVRRRGADGPSVLACTLIPYNEQFELGVTLRSSVQRVHLNHPHCAKFCVLGGASCRPSSKATKSSANSHDAPGANFRNDRDMVTQFIAE